MLSSLTTEELQEGEECCGSPNLKRMCKFETKRLIQRFQLCSEPGQPRMEPGVDGDRLLTRLPCVHSFSESREDLVRKEALLYRRCQSGFPCLDPCGALRKRQEQKKPLENPRLGV